jgi:N-acetylneuraminic acid mutarotase
MRTVAPTGVERHENAFAKVGDKLYLLGGRGIKSIGIYDTQTDSWSQGAAPPIELHHFQAVNWNNLIYVIGAFTGSYTDNSGGFVGEKPVGFIYTYNPATNTWQKGSAIPRPRGSAGAVVYNNKIYIVSGQTQGHTGGWVSWFDEYDPVTDTWQVLPDAPRSRDHFHAVVKNNRLFVAGGRRTNRNPNVFANTVPEVDVYDFAQNKWLTDSNLPPEEFLSIPPIPTQRAGASNVVLGNDLLVIGGESTAQTNAHSEVEALDLENLSWKPYASLKRGRHGTQAILHEGKVFIAAGSGSRGSSPELTSMEMLSPEIASPPGNYPKWTRRADAASNRFEAASIAYQNKIYIFNGLIENFLLNNTSEVYDPFTNQWSQIAPIPNQNGKPSGLTHYGIALVSDTVWIVGGRLEGTKAVTDKVWRYSIATNTWSEGVPLPIKLASGSLAKLGRKLYLFAGGTHLPNNVNQFCVMTQTHYVLDLDKQNAGWQSVRAPFPSGFERIHGAVTTAKGKIYSIAGQLGHDCNNNDIAWVFSYDPYLNKWTRLADFPKANSHAEPGTFTVDGRIITVGGEFSGETVMEYFPNTNTWKQIDTLRNENNAIMKLLAPSAKVIGDKLIVSNGSTTSSGSAPIKNTYIKNFNRTPAYELGFLPENINIGLDSGIVRKKSAWLWTVTGTANYEVNLSNLPSWLSVKKDAGNIVDESAVEFELTFNTQGLSKGIYTHEITATAQGYKMAKLLISLNVGDFAPSLQAIANQTHQEEEAIDLQASAYHYRSVVYQALNLPNGLMIDSLSGKISGVISKNTYLNSPYQVRIIAKDAANHNLRDTIHFTWEILQGKVIQRINAGGTAIIASGKSWSASQFFSGGANQSTTIAKDILATDGDALFISYYTGSANLTPFSFAYPNLPNGTYKVRLYFAEVYWGVQVTGGTGKRVFSVSVEGTNPSHLQNIDLNAIALPPTAIVREATVNLNDGTLNITFSASVDRPLVSAIEIIRIENPLPPQYTLQLSAENGGTVNNIGGSYPAGTSLNAQATPNQGFSFDKWVNGSGQTVSTNNPYTFTLNANTTLRATFIQNPTPHTNLHVRINAGGSQVTTSGQTWAASQGFANSLNRNTTSNINGTADGVLYQTFCISNANLATLLFAYPNLPTGTYRVRLHFVENYWGVQVAGGTGKRVFSVNVEGSTPTNLQNIDFNAIAPPLTAIVRETTVNVSDGTLNMSFIPSADRPSVAAIEIIQQDATTHPPQYTLQLSAENGGTVNNIGGSYPAGTSLTAQATPNQGFTFDKWVNGSGQTVSTNNPYTFALNANTTLRAVFRALLHIRINAAGSQVTTSGQTWVASQGFANFLNRNTTSNISGTSDAILYQTFCISNANLATLLFAYPNLPAGTYRVRLHFVENYWGVQVAGGTGKRVFSVNVEGNTPTNLQNIDFNAIAPPLTAIVRETTVNVSDGTLNMSFIPSIDRPSVAAIEIIQEPSSTARVEENSVVWKESITAPLISPEIKVYPNPFNEQFTIEFQDFISEKARIRLYNSLGQTVEEKEMEVGISGKYEIAVPKLSEGVYFLEVQSEQFYKILRIMKL